MTKEKSAVEHSLCQNDIQRSNSRTNPETLYQRTCSQLALGACHGRCSDLVDVDSRLEGKLADAWDTAECR